MAITVDNNNADLRERWARNDLPQSASSHSPAEQLVQVWWGNLLLISTTPCYQLSPCSPGTTKEEDLLKASLTPQGLKRYLRIHNKWSLSYGSSQTPESGVDRRQDSYMQNIPDRRLDTDCNFQGGSGWVCLTVGQLGVHIFLEGSGWVCLTVGHKGVNSFL